MGFVKGVRKKPAIVLAHGLVHPLGVAADLLMGQGYFTGVPKILKEHGHRVLVPKVSSMGHVKDRAKQLRELIHDWDEIGPDERVIVIAHSMGGLDARYLVSQLDGGNLIKTLVTVGTPHKGSCIADLVWDGHLPDTAYRLKVALGQMEIFSKPEFKKLFSVEGVECLSRTYMKEEFNVACKDDPDVSYFSLSGCKTDRQSCSMWWLRESFNVLTEEEGPNDGMVSVDSATWGRHLGTVGLDHAEQITTDSSQRTVDLYNTLCKSIDEDFCARNCRLSPPLNIDVQSISSKSPTRKEKGSSGGEGVTVAV